MTRRHNLTNFKPKRTDCPICQGQSHSILHRVQKDFTKGNQKRITSMWGTSTAISRALLASQRERHASVAIWGGGGE